MLGVGWTEMLVIGVVALIVIGPKDLPVVMQRIGRFAGMIRRMGTEFQRELNKTTGLNEVRNLRDSITAPLKQTADEIRREFNATASNGTVKPSGVIAPKNPKVESIVDEIHEAAGMTPPAASVEPVAAKPIKGARLTPVPTSHVEAKDLVALKAEGVPAKAKPKPRARKGAAADAAPAPAKAAAAKKPAAKKAAPVKAAAEPAAKAARPKAPSKAKVVAAPAEAPEAAAADKPKTSARRKAPAKAGETS